MDLTERPREPGVSPGGEPPSAGPGHEGSDVSISAIVKFGVGLAIVAVIILVAMWGLLRSFETGAKKQDRPVPPMVAASLRRTPREPRLEPDPLAPRIAAQAREDAILKSYGWADRGAGIARIPIDRAMELLVERGLPAPKPMMPAATPGPTPAAGNRKSGIGNR